MLGLPCCWRQSMLYAGFFMFTSPWQGSVHRQIVGYKTRGKMLLSPLSIPTFTDTHEELACMRRIQRISSALQRVRVYAVNRHARICNARTAWATHPHGGFGTPCEQPTVGHSRCLHAQQEDARY